MSIINNVIKVFVGDKAKKDVSALQPLVEKIKSHESAIAALSHDELRAKTADFKARIEADRAALTEQIQNLEEETLQSEDVDRNENLYTEIDKLKEEAYAITETTLNDLLPEAFAVIKETAKRFVENQTITVNATSQEQLDRIYKELSAHDEILVAL